MYKERKIGEEVTYNGKIGVTAECDKNACIDCIYYTNFRDNITSIKDVARDCEKQKCMACERSDNKSVHFKYLKDG